MFETNRNHCRWYCCSRESANQAKAQIKREHKSSSRRTHVRYVRLDNVLSAVKLYTSNGC
ncbi:MAG: hypothetical protein ACTS45_00495 [Candidatus Hodgkinia cicadicola]